MALSESELIRAIKEKERNNRGYLAKLNTYPQAKKNCRYALDIMFAHGSSVSKRQLQGNPLIASRIIFLQKEKGTSSVPLIKKNNRALPRPYRQLIVALAGAEVMSVLPLRTRSCSQTCIC